MYKFALFSDIHGNLTGLTAVLAALDRFGGADLVFAAGDMVMGGPATDEIIDLLRDRGVRMVRGDSDTDDKLRDRLRTAIQKTRPELSPGDPEPKSPFPARWSVDFYASTIAWMDANLSESGRAFLASLPLSERVEVAPGRELLVCHASPRDVGDRVCAADNSAAILNAAYGEALADPTVEVIAYGHSHSPYTRHFRGKLMLNVASVAFRPDATSMLTILTYRDEQWIVEQHAVPYDAAEEERRMREREVPIP